MSSREAIEARSMREKAPANAIFVELEAPFHDLDPLFVVWHGWYYKYFEIARTALFRAHEIDVTDMMPLHLGFYVIETRAKHLRPLRYGEKFKVAAWFTECESRVGVAYEVTSLLEGHRIARGKTVLVATQRHTNGPEVDTMFFETPEVLLTRIRRGPR